MYLYFILDCFVTNWYTQIQIFVSQKLHTQNMDAAYDFTLSGDLMAITLDFILHKEEIPAALFIDLLTEKCLLISRYLQSTKDSVVLVANLSRDRIIVKLHDTHCEISEMKHITITNKVNIDDQLIYLWTEVRDLMRYYNIVDYEAEIASITKFYHDLDYNQMLASDYPF